MRIIKSIIPCFFLALLTFCLCFSCNKNIEFEVEHLSNAESISPLTTTLRVHSNSNGTITTTINGDIPIQNTHKKVNKTLNIPLIGLYPNTSNKVNIEFENNGLKSTKTITIKTEPLPAGFPDIEINKCERDGMEAGFHACDFHMANNGRFHSTPFIFDDKGAVRWYLNLAFINRMAGPFQQFENGDLVVGTRTHIYKFDMLGNIKSSFQMNPQYGIHHDLTELPNGQILALVGKRNQKALIKGEEMTTDNDFTILLEKDNQNVLKEWDMAKIIDVNRSDINTTRENDWIHSNSLHYNPVDSTILISGKNQGVIKHSWDNELEWILAPHQNWNKAGRNGQGHETKKYLLTAVDANEKPYSIDIQMGTSSHEDFDFPWGQHASKLLPNGNLLLFDNGSPRNYNGVNKYSRVVEYEINEKNKTVKQIWQYGKERGEKLYSSIVSDVDYLENTENILMTSGYIMDDNMQKAKIIEIDRSNNSEVFEATLFLKTLKGNKKPKWGQTDILYRSERMPLIFN